MENINLFNNLFSRVKEHSSPTVNRRSTDGQSQRQYTIGIWKYVAMMALLLTLVCGQVWAETYTWSFANGSGTISETTTNFTSTSGSKTLIYDGGKSCSWGGDSGNKYLQMGGKSSYSNETPSDRFFKFLAPSSSGTVSISYAGTVNKTEISAGSNGSLVWDVITPTANETSTSKIISGLTAGSTYVYISCPADKSYIKSITWTDAALPYERVYYSEMKTCVWGTALESGASFTAHNNIGFNGKAGSGWNSYFSNYLTVSSSPGYATATFSPALALTSNGVDKGRIRVYFSSTGDNRNISLEMNGNSAGSYNAAKQYRTYVAEYTIPDATSNLSTLKMSQSGNSGIVIFAIEVLTYSDPSSCSAPSSVSISSPLGSTGWAYIAGNTIQMHANVTGGSGTPHYTWQKKVSGAWTDIVGAPDDDDYNIENCTAENAGNYRCTVSTGDGCSTTSAQFDVKVFRVQTKLGSDYTFHDMTIINRSEGYVQGYIYLQENSDYAFKVHDGHDGWGNNTATQMSSGNCTNWGMYTNNANYLGLRTTFTDNYLFTWKFNNNTISVTYPTHNQAANKYIYFDNSVSQWSNIVYRIGHSNNNNNSTEGGKTPVSKVPGTANLYKATTMEWGSFLAWHLADNTAWSGSNSIYNLTHSQSTDIANYVDWQKYVVTGDITLTPTTNDGGSPKKWSVDKTDGIKTYTVTSSATNCAVTLEKCTNYGSGTYTALSSGGTVMPTQYVKVTVTPTAGYKWDSFSISGTEGTDYDIVTAAAAGTPGVYIIMGNVTFTAACVVDTYDITYHDGKGMAFSGTHATGHPTTHTYGTATNLKTATKSGYVFGGWYNNDSFTGSSITSLGATSYTADIDLYAKWEKDVYLNLNDKWDTEDKYFAVYCWGNGSSGNTWVWMELVDACAGVYKATIPSNYYDRIIFVQKNSNVLDIWDNKDYQTADLTFPGSKDQYTLSSKNGGDGGKAQGSWASNYTITTFTISYANGGGTGTMSSISSIACGANQQITANSFTRTDYIFTGWHANVNVKVGESTISAGDDIADEATIKDISSNITLTAQWTHCSGPSITANGISGITDGAHYVGDALGTLSVTASAGNGETLSYQWYQYDDATGKVNATVAAGTNNTSTYNIPSNATCTARHYFCVVSEEGCSTTVEGAISGALTLTEATYSVTYKKNGDGAGNDGSVTGTVPSDATEYSSGDSVVVKDPGSLALTNYTFIGWNDKADGSGTYASPGARIKMSGDLTLYAVWQSASSCPGSSGGTVFALTMKTNTNTTKNIGIGESVLLGTTYATTLTGGNVSFTDVGTRTSGRSIAKAILQKGGSGNKDKIYFGGNDAMMTIYLDCALEEGDVITYTGGDTQLSFTTTPVYGNSVYTSSKSYTIPNASALIGKKIIYCWRKTTDSFSVTDISITRPASEYTGLSVTKDPSAGSASAPTISATSVTQGSGVTVTAGAAASGYVFTGWTSENGTFASASSLETTFTPTADNAVATANYAAVKTITLKFLHNGNTVGWAIQGCVTYPSGQTHSITVDGVWTVMTFSNVYAVSDIDLACSTEEWDYLKSSTKIYDDACYNWDGSSRSCDATAPTLVSSDPDNGDTDVNISGTIVLTFSEEIDNVDDSKFSLAGATIGTVEIDGSDATKVNIAYSSASYSSTVTLSSAAGAVSDAAGNASAALSDISFTTKAEPGLTALVSNTRYEVAVMVPEGTTITGSDQYAEGLSANTKFFLVGSASSSTTMKVKNDSRTVDDISFDNSYYFGGAASLTDNTPTTKAIKFKLSGAGTVTAWLRRSAKVKLAKEGEAGTVFGSGDDKDYNKYSLDVASGGTYYIYATDGSTTLYAIKFDEDVCSAPTSAVINGGGAKYQYDAIELTASASGTDESTTYTWYRGNSGEAAAKAAGAIQATSTSGSTYSIASCGTSDAAVYYCVISNGTGCEVTASTSISVTARYYLTYDKNTTDEVSNMPDRELHTPDIYTLSSKVPTRAGYTFSCWNRNQAGTGDCFNAGASFTTGALDETLYAKWTEDTHMVSVAAGAHGTVSPSSVNGVGIATASGNITATPATGYSFNGWTLPSGVTAAAGMTASSNPIQINATADDMTITATWTTVSYAITYNLNDGSLDGSQKTSYNIETEDYDLPTPTYSGHVFQGWYTASDFSGDRVYTLAEGSTGNKNYYAKWGSAVTATWSETANAASSSKFYAGSNGHTVTVYLDQADWDTNGDKDDLVLTASDGVTLSSITKSINGDGKAQVSATFAIDGSVDGDITFALSVPATSSYSAVELEETLSLDDCPSAGGATVLFNQNFSADGAGSVDYTADTKRDITSVTKIVGSGTDEFTYVGQVKKSGAGVAVNSATGGNSTNATGFFQAYCNATSGCYALVKNSNFATTAPTAIKMEMDIWYHTGSSATEPSVTFGIGDDFSNGTGAPENSNVHSGFSIYNNSSPTLVAYKDKKTTIYSTAITQDTWLSIVWVINNSGSDLTYDNPTGSGTTTLANDKFDLWLKTQAGAASTYTKIVSAQAATTATKDLQNIYIGDPIGKSHEFRLDNVKVTKIPSAADSGVASSLAWSESLADKATVNKDDVDPDFQYYASPTPSNAGGPISYSSSDESVATVSSNGTVHIVGDGSTTITASMPAYGCYNAATSITYSLVVASTCADTRGTIVNNDGSTITDNKVSRGACETLTLKLTGHTGSTIAWKKDGEAIVGATSASYTIPAGNSYSGVYSATVEGACTLSSTNSITVTTAGSIDPTIFADEFTVKQGHWFGYRLMEINPGESVSVKTAPTGWVNLSDFKITTKNNIVSIEGNVNRSTGDKTLTLTIANECGSSTDKAFTIHEIAETAKPTVAWIATGDNKGADYLAAVKASESTNTALYKYLEDDYTITPRNCYWSVSEADLVKEYSKYDLIILTDYPNSKTGPSGKGASKSYTNAIGQLIDHKPILTFEAFVAGCPNWGIPTDPSNTKATQKSLTLLCNAGDIFDDKSGKFAAGEDIAVTTASSDQALQGFPIASTPDFVFIGMITDDAKQYVACCERQVEIAARMMVFGLNSNLMDNMTDDGKAMVKGFIDYLMKTDPAEIPDCSVIFTGAGADESWYTTGNWEGGNLPYEYASVRIDKPCVVPYSTNPAMAGYIKIHTDEASGTYTGSLTIEPKGRMIVNKKITRVDGNNYTKHLATRTSDLVLETSSEGNGVLVMGSYDGTNKATVGFYTKAKKTGGHNVNQFIGTPFNDETYVINNYYGTKLYEFRAAHDGNKGTENEWQRLPDDGDMRPFYGYNILTNQASERTLWMEGTLVASEDQSMDMYYNGSSNTENMFANSWPAPIEIRQFKTSDFGGGVATVYIFNAGTVDDYEAMGEGSASATSAGQFIVLPIASAPWTSPTVRVIPSMQAFSVFASGSNQTLTLDYDRLVRTRAASMDKDSLTTATRAPRRAAEEPVVMHLRVDGINGYAANMHMLEREDLTDGFDNGWDGHHMVGDEDAPQLYAITEAGKMNVNCVPNMEGTVIGFRAGTDNQFTFSFGYEGEEDWYLNDLKEQTSTLIDDMSSYTFMAESEDDEARFVISRTPIQQTPTGIETDTSGNNSIVVRKLIINDKVYIIRGGRMYSIDGSLVVPTMEQNK